MTRDAQLAFNLVRATTETAWRDPAPHTDQLIAADKSLAIFAALKEGAQAANENERGRAGCTQAF